MTNHSAPYPFPAYPFGPIPHEDATSGYLPLTADQLCSVRSRTMFSSHDEHGRIGVWIVAWHADHDWLVTGHDRTGTQIQVPMGELTDDHTAGLVFRPISQGRTPRNAGPKPR